MYWSTTKLFYGRPRDHCEVNITLKTKLNIQKQENRKRKSPLEILTATTGKLEELNNLLLLTTLPTNNHLATVEQVQQAASSLLPQPPTHTPPPLPILKRLKLMTKQKDRHEISDRTHKLLAMRVRTWPNLTPLQKQTLRIEIAKVKKKITGNLWRTPASR